MTAIGMLAGEMNVNDVAVSFGVHRTTIWRLALFRTTVQLRIGQDPVDQNVSLLEKNVT
jgi:hypothetical protein